MDSTGSAKFRRYLAWIFAAALIVFVVFYAYNQGTRDGAEHRMDAAANA